MVLQRYSKVPRLLAVFTFVVNVFAIYHQTAKLSDTLLLDCCCGQEGTNYWKFYDAIIYFNKDQVDGLLGDGLSVLANYSLLIHSISLNHEGIYRCIQDSTTLYEYSVTVEVPPQLFVVVNGVKGTDKVIIEESQELIAVCYAIQAKPAVNLTWLLDDRIIDSTEVQFSFSSNANKSKTFDSRAEYQNSLLKWKGNVSCVSSDQTLTKGQRMDIQYFKYALPVVLVTINDHNSSIDLFAVPRNRQIVAACKVYGSHPEAKVTWQINNVPINPEEASSNTAVNTLNNQTYDTVSTLRYIPSGRNGSITCISKLETVGISQKYSVTFHTKAPPTVMISINGQISETVINLKSNDDIIAHCDVSGTGPAFNLTWMINNKRITSHDKNFHLTTTKIEDGQEDDFRATLKFYPKIDKGNVTCIVSGSTIEEGCGHAFYQIEETKGANEELWKNVYLNMAIAVTLFFLFSGAVVLLCKKCCSSNHSFLKTQSQYHLYERSVARPDEQDILAQQQSEEKCLQHVAIPPRELPGNSNTCDKYSSQINNDEDYYSMLSPDASYRGMFNESDLCLVFSMKTGGLYNRWMGTIAQSNGVKKNVVVSSASEAILLRNQIQWDVFVRRVLEIPDNKNLVKVQGICVGASNLYLLHENLTCQTLECRLNRNQNVAKGALLPMDASEVMKHTVGILEGVELIHSYGLLHPGLLTKKILLSDRGTCKLYDFCLSDDASCVIAFKKSQEKPSANTFAPESMLRNEYFKASDAWSVAIVIWALLSGGDLPPFIQNANQDNLCGAWPERYRELRTDNLFECWQTDFSSRPTVRQLRLSFLEGTT